MGAGIAMRPPPVPNPAAVVLALLKRAHQVRERSCRPFWFSSVAVGGTLLAAAALGVPTDVLASPWFTRMTPVRALDYAFWATNSVRLGSLFATFAGVTAHIDGPNPSPARRAPSRIASTTADAGRRPKDDARFIPDRA
jgi:hypothetical protein